MNNVAPKTANSVLRDLKVVIKAMAPERDWRWLMDLSNRVKRYARPKNPKPLPKISPPEMFRKVIADLAEHSNSPAPHAKASLDYRDTLMVGFLLACPIRRRNLAMMRVSAHLQLKSREWHVRFADDETKTRQPIHLVLPTELSPFISTYLAVVRPAIGGYITDDHLWLGQHGKPLSAGTIYQQVRTASARLFGEKINPHAFRSLAATMLAEASPQDALRARPLLGHRRADTTECYYVKASQIRASQNVARAISGIRK